jgi:hypothetical protein
VGPGVAFLMFAGVAGGRGAAASVQPSINHLCLTTDRFNPDSVLKTLESYGIKPRETTQGPVGPLRSYVTMRMENRGGAKEGTPELYFTDPDGILIQLQDVRYCGGSGVLGDVRNSDHFQRSAFSCQQSPFSCQRSALSRQLQRTAISCQRPLTSGRRPPNR